MLPVISEAMTVRTSASEEAARAIIRRLLLDERRGTLVESRDGWEMVRLGSRLSFRIWGLWGPGVEHRLPIEMRYEVGSQAGSTVISLVFRSDEGWYLFRLASVERIFRRAFSRIGAEIQGLLPDATIQRVSTEPT